MKLTTQGWAVIALLSVTLSTAGIVCSALSRSGNTVYIAGMR